MDLDLKKQHLFDLYQTHTESTTTYMVTAVCEKGCADCCTMVGNVDITTLEGLLILRYVKSLDPILQKTLNKNLKLNRKIKKESKYARCAFLSKSNSCYIYPVRPFNCRSLYSLRKCGESGPTIHRQAWQVAETIRLAIQQLDSTGYTGHMSYIIQLLNDSKFIRTYLAGIFAPQEIRDFAVKHGIAINQFSRAV